MAALFDGPVDVHYGFWWIADVVDGPGDITEAFTGQANGLLGGGVPGVLWGRTGLHTGHVQLRIEVLDGPVDPVEGWEDVVEVSFQPSLSATLGAFEEFHDLPDWPAMAWSRARLHARAMDEANGAESIAHDASPIDSYLLQVWEEAGRRPDEVLRRVSQIAAYWHGTTER